MKEICRQIMSPKDTREESFHGVVVNEIDCNIVVS